ncbi:MAG: YqaJ viral recombinase family protein [Pseudomonadota bacterium]|nr:YqaJ viral recombinase family protein [Pseudomonadota bacterium]
MLIVDLVQGTPEWHQHRSKHFNASDAPAMMGISAYKTRNQLLKEIKSGISPEVDTETQKRFDNGHRFESLCRPLAENIIGEELYPVVGIEGKYSASFDGLTIDGLIAFEHKTLNNSLRNVCDLPEIYCVQMEHQLMVSGAKKCLFMASNWDENNNLIEKIHIWYTPDMKLRNRIIKGWEQFEKDLETFEVKVNEVIQAEAIMALPAVMVRITGEVTYSNLPQFKEAANMFIANINTDLKTDEDFVNAEKTVKFCKTAEEDLDAVQKSAIAQTASIDELMRTIDFIKEQLRNKRLSLDKLVKEKKESIRIEMMLKAKESFKKHIDSLQSEIEPIELIVPQPDFSGVMKSKKTLSSLQDAVDGELARCKIESDEIAQDIRTKLIWHKEQSENMEFLFHDLQQIIYKSLDDFKLVVMTRIEKHRVDEAIKLEAERVRIQQEEEIKASAKIEDLRGGETAIIKSEAIDQKQDDEYQSSSAISQLSLIPPANVIIRVLSNHFKVSESTVKDWLLNLNLTKI